MKKTPIATKRRNYGTKELIEIKMLNNPIHEFKKWLTTALSAYIEDANAMVLSTVDEKGRPDSRVVLLKAVESKGFVFFSHYNSPKGLQTKKIDQVALNFYWPKLSKQIRIRGKIQKISRRQSQIYFASRPRNSQLVTAASSQSQIIVSRRALEEKIKQLAAKYKNQKIPCPPHWGGYLVLPTEIEFFQGRNNRLNDRIQYSKQRGKWNKTRLSP